MSKVNTPAAFKRLVEEVFLSHRWASPTFEEYRTEVGSRLYKCVRVRIWRSEEIYLYVDYKPDEVGCYLYHITNRFYGAREVSVPDLYNMAKALEAAAQIVETYYTRLHNVEEKKLVKTKNLVAAEISRAEL